MPSKDPINQKANAWRTDQARPSETIAPARGVTGSRTGLSAQLLRLARRLGRSPEELAEKIPADTLRRIKYPVREIEEPDGTRRFTHDQQVSEGVLSLPQIPPK